MAPEPPTPAAGIASRELGAALSSGVPRIHLETNSVSSDVFAALRAHKGFRLQNNRTGLGDPRAAV